MSSINYRHIRKLKGGEILAVDIKNANGDILYKKGIALTLEQIDLIKNADIKILPIFPNKSDSKLNLVTVDDASKFILNKKYISFFRKLVFLDAKKFISKYIDRTEITQDIIENLVEETIISVIEDEFILYEIDIMKAYDIYIYEQVLSTTVVSIIVAIVFGLNKEEILNLAKIAMLSDIGKVYIEKSLIEKKSELTSKEKKLVKNYAKYGYKLIKNSNRFDMSSSYAMLYMRKKIEENVTDTKEGIDDLTMVLSVASYFSAVVGDRVYRKGINPYEACSKLVEEVGKSFSKEIVIKTINILGYYNVGMLVELRNGETARVLEVNRFKPLVKVISSMSLDGKEIDLSKNRNIKIKTVIIN